MAELAGVSSTAEVNNFEYQWNIKNFRFSSSMPTGTALNSPIFSVPRTSVKGRLKVYPNGVSKQYEDYVSAYLELKNYGDGDLVGKFDLYIPNSDDAVKESGLVNFSLKETFGYPDFVKHECVLNDDILEDETLTLICTLSASILRARVL